MIRVLEPGEERALATIQHSVTDIGLLLHQAYDAFYALEDAEPCEVTISYGWQQGHAKVYSQR